MEKEGVAEEKPPRRESRESEEPDVAEEVAEVVEEESAGSGESSCYAHVNSTQLLVRGCVTNRKNVCLNSNAHEKYACSEASVAATQDTGRVHLQ